MIADDKEGPIEMALKVMTAPVWIPIYLIGVGAVKAWKALPKRKPRQQVVSLPAQVAWTPVSDLERTVYAAMVLAGRPVSNAELARFMGVSEASRKGRRFLRAARHRQQV